MQENKSAQVFDEKYALYKTMLFRIAFTYLKNKEDCEDVLQEVFLKLLTNKKVFENEEHEKRWLIRVTINLCKNQLKSFWHQKKTDFDELLDFAEDSNDLDIISEVLELPEKYKAVIYLYYVDDYKCREIAAILQLKESTVKMRLKKGRELLKLKME